MLHFLFNPTSSPAQVPEEEEDTGLIPFSERVSHPLIKNRFISKDVHCLLSPYMGFHCFSVNLYQSYVPALRAKLQMYLIFNTCMPKEGKDLGSFMFSSRLTSDNRKE